MLLHREVDGTVYEVDSPPVSNKDARKLMRQIGLPEYIDVSTPTMERVVVTLWAALNAPASLKMLPESRKFNGPIIPLLMGGAAVKFLCSSANQQGAMNRRIKDVDFVVRKEQGGRFVSLLCLLDKIAGSRYYHFVTSGDRRFNALRAGERYRVRSVDWTESMQPVLNWVDILSDRIEMRHKIDVRDEFERASENMYTIGVAKLLLTKGQVIDEVDAKDRDALEDSGQGFRILNYPFYRREKVVIGMEEKDMLDACALLHDKVSDSRYFADEIARFLKRDQKLQLTFRLNMENIIARSDWLKQKSLQERQISRISESISAILSKLPAEYKKWDKPWWNRDVETPQVGL